MQKRSGLMWLVAIITLTSSVGFAQQPVRWETSLESAQRLAGQSNRLVLIQFWAPWCGVCKRMEAEVLSQPNVAAELAANYVAVKINADNFPATARQYNVTALPTTVITTAQGQLVDSMRGRIETSDYCARLSKAVADLRQRGAAAYAQMPAVAAPANVASAPQSQPAPAMEPALSGNAQPLADSRGPALGSNPSDDRYADFFRRSQADPATPIAQPPSSSPEQTNQQPPSGYPLPNQAATPPASAPAPVAQAYPPSQPSAASAMPQGQTPAPAVAAMPYGSQTPTLSAQQPTNPMPAHPASPPPPASQPHQAPAVSPPLCLDGYCPVTLSEKQQWTAGDRRWGAIHRGRTYLFLGPDEQRRFFTDPDRYAPAISGNDVVVAAEQGQTMPGIREHGVFFGNRVYLFSGEATLEKFAKNPSQYANQALGATRPSPYAGHPLQ